jgi:hypothetical protein
MTHPELVLNFPETLQKLDDAEFGAIKENVKAENERRRTIRQALVRSTLKVGDKVTLSIDDHTYEVVKINKVKFHGLCLTDNITYTIPMNLIED